MHRDVLRRDISFLSIYLFDINHVIYELIETPPRYVTPLVSLLNNCCSSLEVITRTVWEHGEQVIIIDKSYIYVRIILLKILQVIISPFRSYERASADGLSWEQEPVEDTTKVGSGGTVTGLEDYTYNGGDSLFASLTEESPEDIITSLEVGLDISITQSKYLYGFVWSST